MSNAAASIYFTDLEKKDDKVPPGGEFTYYWYVSPSLQPTHYDPACTVWPYSSGVDMVRDLHSGLIGAILICKPEKKKVKI